jgi:predicted nucleic acid-binding protein
VIVVPDAGPLIYLAGADRLDLLARLFDRVVVPRVVYEEIVVAGAGLMGSAAVSAASWIEIADAPPDDLLARTLDRGEAAAIPLAERLAATLLCDDAAARFEARRRRIPVVGTLGVLRLAKDRGLLDRIRPVIETMRAAGMFVSEALVQEVLTSAAERDDDPTG